MNAEQERLIRALADDGELDGSTDAPPQLQAHAQVVLEIAGHVALSIDKVMVTSPTEGPITAEELQRRGTDPELDARAIDVVLRCGWPDVNRDTVRLTPCIPVPVGTLEAIRDAAFGLGAALSAQSIRKICNELLAEQKRISGLYVEALPDLGPLPEPTG